MKKYKHILSYVLFSISAILLIISGFVFYNSKVKTSYLKMRDWQIEDFSYYIDNDTTTFTIFEMGGVVRDERAAVEIARTIFRSVFGMEYSNDINLPYYVAFDEELQAWFVTSPPPQSSHRRGGVMYIVISKENAEVLAIGATL